jgi:hypothetical protein
VAGAELAGAALELTGVRGVVGLAPVGAAATGAETEVGPGTGSPTGAGTGDAGASADVGAVTGAAIGDGIVTGWATGDSAPCGVGLSTGGDSTGGFSSGVSSSSDGFLPFPMLIAFLAIGGEAAFDTLDMPVLDVGSFLSGTDE